MQDLKEIVAANISGLRAERKMTQFQLAELLNYSDKAVSKWERGESVPDVFVLKQIADYFGVSVDYLLTDKHEDYDREKARRSRELSKNRMIIACLAQGLVWLIATYIFIQIRFLAPLSAVFPAWLCFIYAVPLGSIVLLVFNSVWGRPKLNYFIISLLVWSLLVSFHLTTLMVDGANVALVYVLGIPAQVIIFLWSGLKRVK